MLITLLGQDAFAISGRMTELIKDSPAVARFNAGDGASSIVPMIGQTDLFGQAASVVIDDIFSLHKADQEKLAQQLATIIDQEQLVVVVVNETALPAKAELANVLSRGRVETFEVASSGLLVRWVHQEAERLQVRVEKQAVPAFVARFGGNKFALSTELSRLSWSEPAELTMQSLERMLPMGTEVDVFGLTDAWGQRKLAESLRQLQLLWNQQAAAQFVISMFERQARLLYVCQLSQQAAQPSLASSLGLPQFVVAKLMAAVKRWPPEAIGQALAGLHDLDVAIKTGQIEPEFGLEHWLVQSLI